MRVEDQDQALVKLHEELHRDKIEQARQMSVEERIAAVFEASDCQMGMMLAGAMARLGTDDESEGWAEVGRWMERLDRAREQGLYTNEMPEGKEIPDQ